MGAQAVARAGAEPGEKPWKTAPVRPGSAQAGDLLAPPASNRQSSIVSRGLGIDGDIGAAVDKRQAERLGRAGKRACPGSSRRDLAVEGGVMLGGMRPGHIGFMPVALELPPHRLARIERGAAAQGAGQSLRGDAGRIARRWRMARAAPSHWRR